MSDPFHKEIPRRVRQTMFEVMSKADWHEYMVLTKRAHGMGTFIYTHFPDLSPAHIYWGVTVENQTVAKDRMCWLCAIFCCPRNRWVSAEPLLGPLDLREWLPETGRLVCGAETGPGARYMDPAWALALRDQCREADVRFFFKRDSQGKRELDGRRYEEW